MDILVSRTLYMSCQAGSEIEPGPSALKASALLWQTKNINIIILHHYIITTDCVLVSHTRCVQNHRMVKTHNAEQKQIWESPIYITLFTLAGLSMFIAIFSGTSMYTVYLPISGKSIDLLICELFLHVRRVIVYLLCSKREGYIVYGVVAPVVILNVKDSGDLLSFIVQLCFSCDIIVLRKHVLNEHLLNISPLRRQYFHITYYIYFFYNSIYCSCCFESISN